ncbi:prepilin-type N-terminal cleavage/methylation domain-containing protein [Patescibacteria group bacterium]|nr:prepilin-type N-terminal cleavage/methylation domain-containing protein [Patescibacteria group bacterium]
MFTYKLTKKHTQGFTLVEMLIAVFIFTVSLAALMSVSARGIKSANFAQKRIIADYLALEGIEVVRNIRDSALLSFSSESTWQDVFDQDGCLSQGGADPSCQFILGGNITLEPCTAPCTVYYSESSNAYQHNQLPGYVDSGFTREIKLTTVPSNNREIIVSVIVDWGTDQVVYTDDLMLWL